MVESFFAVVDIGKTNKKVLIFDRHLHLVDSAFANFDEYRKEGVVYEDLEGMTRWITHRIKEFAGRYRIAAISVATHGATAFAIDGSGRLAVPPVAYTTDAGEEFRQEFYRTFGSERELKRETGTAEIGSLVNVGKLIYFLQKRWPQKWRNVRTILYMPQYFGYLFTGRIGAEPTYVGCHTYLYNLRKREYSSLAGKLGILDMLPPTIGKSWEVLGWVCPEFRRKTSLPQECLVTMGIHDSNASLLPYLVKGFDNFVLNSTGTWCVAMHPTDSTDFREEELDALVYYNLNVYQEPVKTSIFKGGTEFDTYREILERINGKREQPAFCRNLYSKIVKERNLFILPAVDQGMGVFPNARAKAVESGIESSLEDLRTGSHLPDFFKDFETGMAVLNISLAVQTHRALSMTGFDGSGTIFIEGGFRKNRAYVSLLGALYPHARIALTGMEEATAFGAAILAKAAVEGVSPQRIKESFQMEIESVETSPIPYMREYLEEFGRLVG